VTSITALGTAGLAITSGNFSDSGTISVGTAGTAGVLTISGPFTQSAGSITVYAGHLLTFASLGHASAYPIFKSTVSMLGSGAEIDTDTQLAFSGGTLAVSGAGGTGANTIGGVGGGNLRVYNNGTVDVGSPTAASFLALATGSLTVGALDPNGTGTGGTLNDYFGSGLTMPAAGTLVVKSLGVINMDGAGAGITTGSSGLDIRAADPGATAGTLNTFGTGNTITGSVTNAGIVNVGASGKPASSLGVTGDFSDSGALNVNSGCTLTVTGALGASGTIDMYGAGVTAGSLGLNGGTLTTHGGDAITAPLTNAGTITFVGALHTLSLTGAYTQTAAGTLAMRLDNGSPSINDVFTISAGATLNGTLSLTGLHSLTAGQTWVLIDVGAGVITNDFATIDFPDQGAWLAAKGPPYSVQKLA
jgi:hypothetical protein